MSEERQRLVLVLLLVALVAVAGWRLLPLLVADGEGGGGRRPAAPADVPEVLVAELALGELSAEPRNYDPGRDPFSYYTPPPPPPPEPQGPTPEELARRAEEERRRRAAEQAARQEAVERAPPAPEPPSFQLTYLGSFGPEGRRIAVFTDGEEIYNALVGDVIDDSFVVADIGFESVTITFVGFPDEPGKRVAIGG